MRLRAPVAMITWFADTSVTVPSAARTDTLRPGSSVPSPRMTSILFFFMRNCTPFDMPSATPRLRFTMPEKSASGLPTEMP